MNDGLETVRVSLKRIAVGEASRDAGRRIKETRLIDAVHNHA